MLMKLSSAIEFLLANGIYLFLVVAIITLVFLVSALADTTDSHEN